MWLKVGDNINREVDCEYLFHCVTIYDYCNTVAIGYHNCFGNDKKSSFVQVCGHIGY